MMTGCDSIGTRMRRDWGSVFAPNVKDSRLDAGVTFRARPGGYRLGVIRQDDAISRDGLQGARLRVARGFILFPSIEPTWD
jgi:hypothetical protein